MENTFVQHSAFEFHTSANKAGAFSISKILLHVRTFKAGFISVNFKSLLAKTNCLSSLCSQCSQKQAPPEGNSFQLSQSLVSHYWRHLYDKANKSQTLITLGSIDQRWMTVLGTVIPLTFFCLPNHMELPESSNKSRLAETFVVLLCFLSNLQISLLIYRDKK